MSDFPLRLWALTVTVGVVGLAALVVVVPAVVAEVASWL